jgi:hypothetical protein
VAVIRNITALSIYYKLRNNEDYNDQKNKTKTNKVTNKGHE